MHGNFDLTADGCLREFVLIRVNSIIGGREPDDRHGLTSFTSIFSRCVCLPSSNFK